MRRFADALLEQPLSMFPGNMDYSQSNYSTCADTQAPENGEVIKEVEPDGIEPTTSCLQSTLSGVSYGPLTFYPPAPHSEVADDGFIWVKCRLRSS